MTVEAFFDSSEKGDVKAQVEELLELAVPHKKTEKDKPSPPFVSFGWGTTTYIEEAVIKSVSAKYTRFRPDGMPIRATATITLEELRPVDKKQNPTSGSFDIEVERMVLPGDTLPLIAYEELGSSDLWRVVADANGIDDPFRLRVGTSLVIPGLHSLPSSN
jgi:nucleoid-associated protein YgaU